MNSVRATRKNHRANPIARSSGSIDVNTKLDTKFLSKSASLGHGNPAYPQELFKNRHVEKTVYDVFEGDILMGLKKGQARFRGRTNLCFASANGLPKTPDFLDELCFAGIAVTNYSQTKDGMREQQGFVSTYAGLTTVMNSGQDPIYPGDIIRVTMPPVDDSKRPAAIDGTPNGRIVFGMAPALKTDLEHCLAKFTGSSASASASTVYTMEEFEKEAFQSEAEKERTGTMSTAEFAEARRKAYDEELAKRAKAGESGGAPPTDVTRLVTEVVNEMHKLRRFQIGRAMGFAAKGQALDIVLG